VSSVGWRNLHHSISTEEGVWLILLQLVIVRHRVGVYHVIHVRLKSKRERLKSELMKMDRGLRRVRIATQNSFNSLVRVTLRL